MLTETQRLFFALWPTEAQRAALAAWSAALPHELGRRVNPDNLHITLLFLGALNAEQRQAMEAVAERITVRPFALRIDRFGYWRRPQVVWAGSGAMPPGLLVLVKQLRQGALSCDLRVDSRPYEIHLTLYRKVRRAPRQWPDVAPLHWPVEGFALVESLFSAEGVRYEVRRRWSFADANSTSE